MRSQLAVLSTIVLVTTATPSFSRTWYILPDGTGDAPTIQAGVDSAAAGDVVLIAAGTYSTMYTIVIDGTPTNVCVAINKEIRLISEDGPATTAINATAADIGIYLDGVGANGEVSGFRIRTVFEPFGCVDVLAPSAAVAFKTGIKCSNSSARISDNVLSEHGNGIVLTGSPVRIVDNTIAFCFFGIICYSSSDASITDNAIYMCAEGIHSEASRPVVASNEMYDGCTAILSAAGSSVLIADNTFRDFWPIGIACGSGSVNVERNHFADGNLAIQLNGTVGISMVRDNIFYNNYSGAMALAGNLNASITIEGNTIDRAGYGVFCEGSSPTIRRNIFTRAGSGVSCILASPKIECNNMFNVTTPYAGGCSDQTGLNGNISADPQFCGVLESGNYHLQGDSPCAPGNHPNGSPCGQIGALGVACGTVPTKSMTWGQFKTLYDGKRR